MEYQSPAAAFSNTFEDSLLKQQALGHQEQVDRLNQAREERLANEFKQRMADTEAVHRETIREKQTKQTLDELQQYTKGDYYDPEFLDRAERLGVPVQAMGPDGRPTSLKELRKQGVQGGFRFPGTKAENAQQELAALVEKNAPAEQITAAGLRLGIPGDAEKAVTTLRGRQTNYQQDKDMQIVGADGKVLSGVAAFDPAKGNWVMPGGAPLPPGAKAVRVPPPKDPTAMLIEDERLKKMRQDEDNNQHDAEIFAKMRKDDDFLNGLGLMFRKGMTLPTAGMGKEANAVKLLASQRGFKLKIDQDGHASYTDPETGVTKSIDVDIAANHAALTANTQARTLLTKNYASVSAFLDTADRNSKILEDTLKKIPNTDVTPLNEVLRSASTKLGSEDMAAFNAMLPSVKSEYARVIQQPNLTGVLSDTARKEVGETLPANATVKQIRIALKLLRQEGENRKKATKQQIDNFDQELHKVGAESVIPKSDTTKPKKSVADWLKEGGF